jgi:CheY-like chemotaxis protein
MKILIVDDSKLMQKTIAKILGNKFLNAEISLASNGEEGFALFKEIQPDVVTIDLLMPVMNGIELLKLLSKEQHNSKLFVLSADVQKVVQEEVKALGATFIAKPFTEEKAVELVTMIQKSS